MFRRSAVFVVVACLMLALTRGQADALPANPIPSVSISQGVTLLDPFSAVVTLTIVCEAAPSSELTAQVILSQPDVVGFGTAPVTCNSKPQVVQVIVGPGPWTAGSAAAIAQVCSFVCGTDQKDVTIKAFSLPAF